MVMVCHRLGCPVVLAYIGNLCRRVSWWQALGVLLGLLVVGCTTLKPSPEDKFFACTPAVYKNIHQIFICGPTEQIFEFLDASKKPNEKAGVVK